MNEIDDAIFIHHYKENELPGKFVDANQAALDLVECTKSEILELTPLDILESHSPEDFLHLQDDFLRTKHLRTEMVAAGRKGKKTFIEINARLVDFSGSPYVVTVARDIAEQKQLEAALRKSEEKYRTHLERVHDVIYTIDNDLLITSVTPSVREFLGYAPEEFLGKYYHHCLFILQPEYLNKAGTNIVRLLAGEQVGTSVYGFVAKDGRKVYGEICGTPIVRDGRIEGTISVIRDVTDRVLTQQALGESEARYRNLVNLAPVGIVEVDLVNDRLISANDAVCSYSGYSREELLSIPTASFFTEESSRSREQRMAALSKGEQVPHEIEYRFRTKKGKDVWVLFNARHEIQDGRPIRLTGVLYDITARKKAELQLRESEERLRTILENMPVMLAAIDESGRILSWNSECEKITGYSKEQLGRSHDTVWRLLYPSQAYRKKVVAFVRAHDRSFLNYETAITCNDGTARNISWSNISRHFPVPGWYSWIVGFDITGLRQSESALRCKQDELNAVVNNIPDLVWMKNRALQYLFINRSLEIFCGITGEAIYGTGNIPCLPPDRKDACLRHDMDVIKMGITTRHEEMLIGCNGQEHLVDCVRMPIADESGAIIGIVGICHDITEQKRKEKELQAKLDAITRTVEEKSDELAGVTAELQIRKSDLEREHAELESVRQQVTDNRNALSTLARNMENIHRETEHQILVEIRKILVPIIQRLRNSKGSGSSSNDINLLATFLEDQTSRLSGNTRIIFSLSPAELQIASMIKNGMNSEEIAAHLHVSVNTIKTHRKNIRRKLNLQNSAVNLTSHLKAKLS